MSNDTTATFPAGTGEQIDLQSLGFDEWFSSRASDLLGEGRHVARVMAVDRGAFLLRDEQGEIAAELSGKFRFDAESTPDLPSVGDWVCAERSSPELAIIHALLPRRTYLRRKCPGKTVEFQMIATNLDVAFIIQSCHYDFNLRRLDRYLVAASEGGIEPVIVLSKTDLVSPEELDNLIGQIRDNGVFNQVIPLSNTTGSGLEQVQGLLVPGQTCCLLGSSGVGKTTLLNRLVGADAFATKVVSGTGEGVHTTSRRQLLVLDNGAMLVDTPGMREFGLLGASEGIEESFADIKKLSDDCRFADCTHSGEPDCAVQAALDSGEINAYRYQSYLKLKKETQYHDLTYVEKRKKDKNFGRLIKEVMKHKRQHHR